MSKRTRVSSNNINDDDTIMYLNPKPLKMIFPVNVLTNESKNAATKRNTSFEKVSALKGEPFLENPVETMITFNPYPGGNKVNLDKTTSKEQDIGRHVESPDDQLVEPNVETYVSTSTEPQPEHPIDSVVDAPKDGNDDSDFFEDKSVEND